MKREHKNDPTIRKLIQERDRFTKQIAGRQKTIAQIDVELAGSLAGWQELQLQQQRDHQETFLTADSAKLAEIVQNLADLGVS